MSGRGLGVVLRLTALMVAGSVAYALLRDPFRDFEAAASSAVLTAVGVHHVTSYQYLVLFQPISGGALVAILSPACSALPSILALCFLGFITPRGHPMRRLSAIALAVTTVAVGNIVRIAASVGVGIMAGQPALVLFHDWVGSIFIFAYSVAGYMLMLSVVVGPFERGERAPAY